MYVFQILLASLLLLHCYSAEANLMPKAVGNFFNAVSCGCRCRFFKVSPANESKLNVELMNRGENDLA